MSEAMREKEWMEELREQPEVRQAILVRYLAGSDAEIKVFQKDDSEQGWKLCLTTPGYVGKNGVGKTKEGDATTPLGCYELTMAFGIKENPGTTLPYLDVKDYHYWCSDEYAYNQLLDIREHPHDCKGEHMIAYQPHYNYGMVLDYNKECVYDLGSAIFMHCIGPNPYTGGCVAVPEETMRKILPLIEPGARIVIYKP